MAVALIGAAMLYPGLGNTSSATSSTLQPGQGQTQTQQVISTSTVAGQSSASGVAAASSQALLVVQLTDPPVVPTGTLSLNLTYSAIHFIVSEPGQNNLVTTSNVTVTPQGGSATVDLLQLQNVSQTIATANLPVNSTIYSISFTVSSISVDVNGTNSAVTLATGGSTFQVALAQPSLVGGTTAALLQLNPVIVNTPSGYQMIPSAVAIVKGSAQISTNEEKVGSRQQLTQQDSSELNRAAGNVSATLVSLSSTGNMTTITVQVNNTGSSPFQLVAIGLHGNFTQEGAPSSCTTTSTSTSSISSTSSNSSSTTHNRQDGSNALQAMGAADKSGNSAGDQQSAGSGCGRSYGSGDAWNQLVFVPAAQANTTTASTSTSSASSTSSSSSTSSASSSSSSTTSTSSSAALGCTSVGLTLPRQGGDAGSQDQAGLTIAPGECVTLTFTGAMTFGSGDHLQSSVAVVPNTAAGQTYTLHVIASDSAQTTMDCTLPLTATSCSLANPHND
ncbi:MAG: hypothetical protein JRN23_03760 [Nitrososphaerota archaeon]|nr:hypothetical protein [Nitrososphaerota archaeon]MDG6967689.1 hypothetical protein [Nitrososphaerota archaeon]MDG6978174.1 hypothetical protein [Nitrososphaerota archaeon]MDG7021028.1 hypothetical protein [Nitrososphaerota archaeon]MDG7022374.1 hypothetical protein [Nitrososphaerota archaeon]